MQLDFKLKKKWKKWKREPFMHYLPFPVLLELELMSIQWIFLLVQAHCLHAFDLFQFPVSLLSSKKRVNCIVDSTVSSLYETI